MNDTDLPGFASALLGTLGATALVALLAWVVLSLVRRFNGRFGGGTGASTRPAGRLRIVQSVPLGTRERAVLIADDEREYLLGVAAGGVTLLDHRRRGAGKLPAATAEDAESGAERGAAPSGRTGRGPV